MPSIYINESDISGQDQLFISNIYSGKILGEIMRLQDKTVNINTNGETTVTYDTDYTGLNSVKIITNVPNPSTGTINITANANQINVKDYEFADVDVDTGITPLAKTLTLKTPNRTTPETYSDFQIITSIDNTEISQPTNPTTTGGHFDRWEDENGNTITFPYTPTSDITLYCIFQYVRTDMEYSTSGARVLWNGYDTYSVNKTNDGICIIGEANNGEGTSNSRVLISLAKTADAASLTSARVSFTTGTYSYNGETWYYCRSSEMSRTVAQTLYGGVYATGKSIDDYDGIMKATLDHYFYEDE